MIIHPRKLSLVALTGLALASASQASSILEVAQGGAALISSVTPIVTTAVGKGAETKNLGMEIRMQENIQRMEISAREHTAENNDALARLQMAATEKINNTNQWYATAKQHVLSRANTEVALATIARADRDSQREFEISMRLLDMQEKFAAENRKLEKIRARLDAVAGGVAPKIAGYVDSAAQTNSQTKLLAAAANRSGLTQLPPATSDIGSVGEVMRANRSLNGSTPSSLAAIPSSGRPSALRAFQTQMVAGQSNVSSGMNRSFAASLATRGSETHGSGEGDSVAVRSLRRSR